MKLANATKIVIDDFTGGRNSVDAINQLRNNETPDDRNVYVENRALIQRRGLTATSATIDGIANNNIVQFFESQLASGSLLRMMMVSYRTAIPAPPNITAMAYSDDGSTFSWVGYAVGTCGTTGTSATIDFAGGTLMTQHAAVGDFFLKSGGTALNKITAINSDTQIVVTSTETITAGTSYKIIHQLGITTVIGPAAFDVSSAQNVFWGSGGGGRAFRYDGTNVRVVSGSGSEGYSMPTALKLLAHKNYLFSIMHETNGVHLAIQWSAIKDPTSWPAANFQTITTAQDPIRGFVIYGDSIVIFTRSRMFRLLGDTFDPSNPTYVVERITTPPNVYFAWARTAVLHQGVLKFLTSDGWYSYDGGSYVSKISQPLQADTDGFLPAVFTQETVSTGAFAYVWKEDMYCLVSLPSSVQALFVQDKRGKWWKWTYIVGSNVALSDMRTAQFGASTAAVLLLGSATQGKLYTADTGNQDVASGTAIQGYWTSKEFVFPADVEFTHALVTMKKQSAGNLTLSFSIDRRTFVDKTLDMTAGAGTVIRKMVQIARVGKAIRLKVANSTINQTFEIYSIELFFEPGEGFRK